MSAGTMVFDSTDGARSIRVSFYVFFPAGGIGRYTHELAGAVSEQPGVEVEVMCPPDFHWRRADHHATWPGLLRLSHRWPVFRRGRFLAAQVVSPRRAIRRARTWGADVLHLSNVNHLGLPAWKRRIEKSGLPVVISAHDVRRQVTVFNRAWEERQLKACYRLAEILFVHSQRQARDLIEFAGVPRERVRIVPHGTYAYPAAGPGEADALRQEMNVPEGRPILLFFGQIRDEKNLEGMLEALALSRSRPLLVVAGKAGGRHRGLAYYRRRARELGLGDDVRMIDRHIDDREVARYFALADAVALPYRASFTSQSGVLSVAAHFSRPVMVSSAPVLHETVTEAGIGVACRGDGPAELAEGLDRLMDRLAEGSDFPFEAYRRNSSWEENARRTVGAYRELVGGRGSRS